MESGCGVVEVDGPHCSVTVASFPPDCRSCVLPESIDVGMKDEISEFIHLTSPGTQSISVVSGREALGVSDCETRLKGNSCKAGAKEIEGECPALETEDDRLS